MALNLKYTLKNIGNIDNAEVTIKPLTIIAGENSSGKTFLTKSLYTILNSIYKDHFSDDLIKKFTRLNRSYKDFTDQPYEPSQIDHDFQSAYNAHSKKMSSVIQELSNAAFKDQNDILNANEQIFDDFKTAIDEYLTHQEKTPHSSKYTEEINNIKESFANLLHTIKNRMSTIVKGTQASLNIGFKKNYQITNLHNLIKQDKKEDLEITIDGIGTIKIDKQAQIHFSFQGSGIEEIQSVKNIVFFDSPVYLKIRKALEKHNSGLLSFFNTKEEDSYLRGYPEYIEQIYAFMNKEYIHTPDFNEISQNIQETIAGKLDTTESGDIQYVDTKGSIIPISLTAMGISNLGLIDLLLRNNVINKGSFLIMDEPEVHLHPQWQVALANILYKIAQSGANIILATHSLDLLKAFQVKLQSDEEQASKIIAINKMPFDQEFSQRSEIDKIGTILDDLSQPYYDLYMNKYGL